MGKCRTRAGTESKVYVNYSANRNWQVTVILPLGMKGQLFYKLSFIHHLWFLGILMFFEWLKLQAHSQPGYCYNQTIIPRCWIKRLVYTWDMGFIAREVLVCMLPRTYLSDSKISLLFTLGVLCHSLVCCGLSLKMDLFVKQHLPYTNWLHCRGNVSFNEYLGFERDLRACFQSWYIYGATYWYSVVNLLQLYFYSLVVAP